MSSLRRAISKLFDEADIQELEDQFPAFDASDSEEELGENEIDVDEVDHMIIGKPMAESVPERRSSTHQRRSSHYWGQISTDFSVTPKSNSFRTALAKVHSEQVLFANERAPESAGETAEERRRRETLGAVFGRLDRNGNGLLEREELEALFLEAAENIQLRSSNMKQVIGAAIDVLMDDVQSQEAIHSAEASMKVDEDNIHMLDLSANLPSVDENDAMNKHQFICLFQRHPDLLMVFASERRRLAVADGSFKTQQDLKEEEQVWSTRWTNQRVHLVWLALYVVATVVAFAASAYRYAQDDTATQVVGACLVVARGSGQCLNLNCALVLIPMAKHLMTWLRLTKARFYFPFNCLTDIHKVMGVAILFWTICHVSGHMCNCHRMAHYQDEEDLALMMNVDPDDIPADVWGGWNQNLFHDQAGITGILMVLLIGVAYPLSLPYVRRNHFNVFWNSHHLLIGMLILMCFHDGGTRTVFWLMIPLLLYLIPRFFRVGARAKVVDAQIKPGGVLCLRLEKRKSWDGTLCGGMYARINVPSVGLLEWHPFTMTSSPSDPYIEFYIRNLGDFTQALHSQVIKLNDMPNSSNKSKVQPSDKSEQSHRTQDCTDFEASEYDALLTSMI